MEQGNILVVGSLNMDQVVRVPRMPALGETLLGAGSLRLVPGGKGANQAVAMARLGAPVAMAGCVGNDPFGAQLLSSLQADGIDTSLVVVEQEEASGVAFIFLGRDGDNAIVVASGANLHIGRDERHMRHIQEASQEARALVLQLEIPLPTVLALIEIGHKARVPVVLNLAPALPLPREALERISILIVNESEASLLTGQRVESIEDARIVSKVLHSYGIPTVVVTLGGRGALLTHTDESGQVVTLHRPAPNVQVIDTTAAGDCFVGALTVALSEERPPDEALRFAVAASALKVTKFGAQSGMPTRREVEAFL